MQNKIFSAKLGKDFYQVGNRLVLSKEYLAKVKPKKITGTTMGELFERNGTNQVKLWMKMFGLYKEPFDPIYSQVGQCIEPKLRDYYSSLTNVKYQSYDPSKIKWDAFKDVPIFGGIPDGEPLDANGKVDEQNHRMIEIKTASIDSFIFNESNGFYYMQKDENGKPVVKLVDGKIPEWFTNNMIQIPESYLFQLNLYLYLRNATKGSFVVGFVPTDLYIRPQDFDVKTNKVCIVNCEQNRELFQKYIDYAKKWYETYITSGVSPALSQNDINWLQKAYDNN